MQYNNTMSNHTATKITAAVVDVFMLPHRFRFTQFGRGDVPISAKVSPP